MIRSTIAYASQHPPPPPQPPQAGTHQATQERSPKPASQWTASHPTWQPRCHQGTRRRRGGGEAGTTFGSTRGWTERRCWRSMPRWWTAPARSSPPAASPCPSKSTARRRFCWCGVGPLSPCMHIHTQPISTPHPPPIPITQQPTPLPQTHPHPTPSNTSPTPHIHKPHRLTYNTHPPCTFFSLTKHTHTHHKHTP